MKQKRFSKMLKTPFFMAIISALVFTGFQSCKQKDNADTHNSKNSVDWVGVYTGTTPCADCEGIEETLTLNEDNTYIMHYYYIGKENNIESSKGTFKWDETGNIVILSDTNSPHYFKVGENKLIQLDMEGKEITGEHADMYVLTKTEIDKAHNSKNSLDWAGVYTGTTPCADCEGINVNIILNADETYQVTYTYLGKKSKPAVFSGKFKWNDAGSTIILDDKELPPYYKVGENKLIQLDMEGKEITGSNFADMYILNKVSKNVK